MTRQEFWELTQKKTVMLDGATGTNLQARGMPSGVCPEQWIRKHPSALVELQKEYIRAGSDIIYAPTFSGNRVKLKEYGLSGEAARINRELVGLSKQAVRETEKAWVAGDLTMTGRQLYPIGTMEFEELVDIYKEQASYLLLEGVDLFVVETMTSLQECRAAVLAVKEICELPVLVTLTFQEEGRTLYGTEPAAAALVLSAMGVDAVGLNCSTGPDKMAALLEQMRPYVKVPLIAKPNAGLPCLREGRTVYDMGPEEFAEETAKLVRAGAGIVGGCCGTAPEHIKRLAEAVGGLRAPRTDAGTKRALSTERTVLDIKPGRRFYVVGERINPTGKKALQAELREGSVGLAADMAQEQVENGADILDVNMGTNGIDEKEMMQKALYEIGARVDAPLCIDSSHISVIEAALRIYPGRALINSISLEKEKLERLIPMAKKYGAMFILLPLSDRGLPENMEEKKEIIGKVLKRAYENGLTEEDVVVDGLVTTVGANPQAAFEVLETIRYCREELGLATICGLSNISFGLPARQFVNSAFLAMAIREGLTMAIANPSQDLLMNTALAADLLLNREDAAARYLDRAAARPVTVSEAKGKPKPEAAQGEAAGGREADPVSDAVVKGNRKQIVALVEEALAEGSLPAQIINEKLIPAINKVGDLFNRQVYFLPQLINSAETMKTAIDFLEPMLKREEGADKPLTVVIATVAGDIHDIGKNLVALMLRNYGFRVLDLGKDVPAETIVRTAKEEDADIIGLSALMTTTMMEMKTVVELARREKVRARVIIGGAAVTESFAGEIGADGYSEDAGEAVLLVKRLLNLC